MTMHKKLTPRETEILQLAASDVPNKIIADRLKIGRRTVEKHREHLMAKLGINSCIRLTHYALAHGLAKNLYRKP